MIASHSSSRAIAGHVRNMSEEMIKQLAAKGGVVAMNFHAPYLDQARNDYERRIQPLVNRLVAQYPGEGHESRRREEVARQFGPPPAVSWTFIAIGFAIALAIVPAGLVYDNSASVWLVLMSLCGLAPWLTGALAYRTGSFASAFVLCGFILMTGVLAYWLLMNERVSLPEEA